MPEQFNQDPLSILIVDDEEAIRELLKWMLQDVGHTVHLAADGPAALEFLDTHGPVDVVLSDINMPYMDGIELRRQLRAMWPDLPVLLTSGRPPPQKLRHFLPKPFRWEALALAINTVIARPGAGYGHCGS